jgi:hypothetical protein
MFTYRIYVDGGHHVIGTFEGNTLKGEAKFIPKSLQAYAGSTSSKISIRRVLNQLNVLTDIEYTDLLQSNGTVWGNSRSTALTALNIFFEAPIYAAGSGTITSVNGDTGPIVVLHGGEINRSSTINVTIANTFTALESNLNGVITDVQTLFTIVGKGVGKTAVKDDSGNDQIEITSSTTKINNVLTLDPKSSPPANPEPGWVYSNIAGDLFIGK